MMQLQPECQPGGQAGAVLGIEGSEADPEMCSGIPTRFRGDDLDDGLWGAI